MLKETDILKAARNEIKALYPNYQVYLDDIKENFRTPCFFLKLIRATNQHTMYTCYNVCTMYITYFSAPEADALELYEVKDSLVEKFWSGLQVLDRNLKFGPITSNTDGQDSDLAQVTLPFSYYDAIPRIEPEYKMQELHQNSQIKY